MLLSDATRIHTDPESTNLVQDSIDNRRVRKNTITQIRDYIYHRAVMGRGDTKGLGERSSDLYEHHHEVCYSYASYPINHNDFTLESRYNLRREHD